jgi:hypothetical protein
MPRPKIYVNDSARVAAFRARKALVTLSVDLPASLIAELDQYMKFKNLTKTAVIEKLLRSQLLRKR